MVGVILNYLKCQFFKTILTFGHMGGYNSEPWLKFGESRTNFSNALQIYVNFNMAPYSSNLCDFQDGGRRPAAIFSFRKSQFLTMGQLFWGSEQVSGPKFGENWTRSSKVIQM